MTWSDEARAAALEARRRKAREKIYQPGETEHSLHLTRKEMARHLRDLRRATKKHGYSVLGALTTKGNYYETKIHTNVKGAATMNQGLGGSIFLRPGQRASGKWAGTVKNSKFE